jgi:hypothetical protein
VYHGISLFALGIGLTLLITEVGKRWLGRLRPHFIGKSNLFIEFNKINSIKYSRCM